MDKHLTDFVWMARRGEQPEKVKADSEEISRRMVAGYVQVFPAETKTESK
jgi:hypothetical protein